MKPRKRNMKRSLKRSMRRRRRRLMLLPLRTARPAKAVEIQVAAMMLMTLRPLLQAMIQDLVLMTKPTKQPNPRKLKRKRRQRRKPRRKLLAPIPPMLTLAPTQVQALIKMMIPMLMMIARRERTLKLVEVRVVAIVVMIIKSHLTLTWFRIPMLRSILRKLRRLSRLP